jgi:hypothetical protein
LVELVIVSVPVAGTSCLYLILLVPPAEKQRFDVPHETEVTHFGRSQVVYRVSIKSFPDYEHVKSKVK